MRITFLVNHDIAALLALNYLIPELKQHQSTVFYTRKSQNIKQVELARLAEFDSESIASASNLTGFKEFDAQRLNKINTSDYQTFADSRPDLVISIRHMSILKSKVIGTPSLGVINLHSGILPSYQGVMATFWALLNKEQKIGTTLHFIEDSSIDTGSIISKSLIEAQYQKSYLWNVLNIYKSGCVEILNAIKALESGQQLISEPQTGQANYYSFPESADITRCELPLFNRSDSVDLFIQ